MRVRRTPGTSNKPPGDVVAELPADTTATVADGPQTADGMTWWLITLTLANNTAVRGWAAEQLPSGLVLLEKVINATPEPIPPTATFAPGDEFKTTTIVRLRKTPGTTNKPADDVIADLPEATRGVIDTLSLIHI